MITNLIAILSLYADFRMSEALSHLLSDATWNVKECVPIRQGMAGCSRWVPNNVFAKLTKKNTNNIFCAFKGPTSLMPLIQSVFYILMQLSKQYSKIQIWIYVVLHIQCLLLTPYHDCVN